MMNFRKICRVFLLIILCTFILFSIYKVNFNDTSKLKPSETIDTLSFGKLKTIENFYSPELNNYKILKIYLPYDYDTSNKNYPVIYMQDAQNLFNKKIADHKEVYSIDKTLESLYKQGKHSGIILVGIDSFETTRTDEYNPFTDTSSAGTTGGKETGGKGNAYADFLVNTLKPYIDQNYRTLKDKKNTAIIGSSYGGVISLYTGIKYNETFGMIGSFSFCSNVNHDAIVSYLNDNFTKTSMTGCKIYLYCGTNDFAYPDTKEVYIIGT